MYDSYFTLLKLGVAKIVALPSLYVSVLFVLIIFLIFTLWMYHKIRKIHLATYRLLEDSATTRQEMQGLFAQLQAYYTLEKKLHLAEPLPPLRGWAGSPDFLLTVADNVLLRKPLTIFECSSGVSTIVIARCIQMNGLGHVYSLEHDREYAQKTIDMLDKYNLSEWATVLYAPLVSGENRAPWYDESKIPQDTGPIELLVIDGPPASIAPLARFPAIPRLIKRMDKAAIVVLDDAARDDEIEIVKRWLQQEPEFNATYLSHEKGCVVLQRKGRI
jgi:predicted O-methyltransferase YrrM